MLGLGEDIWSRVSGPDLPDPDSGDVEVSITSSLFWVISWGGALCLGILRDLFDISSISCGSGDRESVRFVRFLEVFGSVFLLVSELLLLLSLVDFGWLSFMRCGFLFAVIWA